MTGRKQYDLAVIGAGMAGMAAALFAAEQGWSTLLVGRSGETWFTGGMVDLMGVHPIEAGQTWDNPWLGIEALVKDFPDHPYARMAPDDIQAALTRFYQCLQDAGLPYYTQDPRNSQVVTSQGTIRLTHGLPQTMQPGVSALAQKSPCLLVDIKGLRGFSARQMAERLKNDWPGIKTLTVTCSGGFSEVAPLPLARDLEIPAKRRGLAESIAPYAREVEFVGLPAVMGVNRAQGLLDEFSAWVGKPVFEIPTMPPSIPGLRMKEALMRALIQNQVHCSMQSGAVAVSRTGDGRFLIDDGAHDAGQGISADWVILATGRFLGGGLTATPAGIQEPLLGLPLHQPEQRREWHRTDVFDLRGHALNQAGIETDRYFRPVGKDGGPVYENLSAVGAILAHQDWIRMKCGSGMSIATACQAVNAMNLLKQSANAA